MDARRLAVVVGVLALFTSLWATALPAHADIEDLPNTPPPGCLDYTSGAVGMFQNTVTPAGGFTLDVEGPVVQVVVEWLGEWRQEPADAELAIEVTGPGGSTTIDTVSTQSSVDATDTGGVFVYSYYDDITDEFPTAAGSYDIDITPPPDPSTQSRNAWWGASVTVVYDTTPCATQSEIVWKIGGDYYFGGVENDLVTTELIVYDLAGTTNEDFVATIQVGHGGADSTAVFCRASNLWVAIGDGAPPSVSDELVDPDGTPNPTFGASEAATDPFTPEPQGCAEGRTISPPVTAVRGGDVGPEYSLVEFDIAVPAGSSWIALQLESPVDNNDLSGTRPESGAWAGAGILLIPRDAPPLPDVALEKTVLDGAGGTCPGVEGTDELVSTAPGGAVTYCFRVVNTGTTALDDITIVDPDLGITDDDMTLVSGDETVPLLTGEDLVYSFETTADVDLVNVATVVGTPVDDAGAPIPDLDDVTDSNDAAVVVVIDELPVASIMIEKTVLDGAGAACPGTEGTDELVSGPVGTLVTYCFRVVNDGETLLLPVEVDDPDLEIDDSDMTLVSGDDTVPLAPGDELVYSYEATITDDLLNVAITVGTPVDADGVEIPELVPVTDDNDASVEVVVLTPSILLEKTVLDGAGGDCPGEEGTDELATGVAGTPVTYCFRVVNNGEVALFPVTIDDPDLGITSDDMTLVSGDDTVALEPGDELVFAADAMIEGDLVNVATVTGTPVDEQPPVTDTNDAEVEEVPPPVPSIAVEKTVLAGADGVCPGVEGTDELVAGTTGTAVTYCVRVVNTGGVALAGITVVDDDLGLTQADMTLVAGDDTVPLEPGDELVWSVQATITADLVNTVVATGTPVDGQPPVTDDNDASVVLRPPPTVTQRPPPTVIQRPPPTVTPPPPLQRLPRTGSDLPDLVLAAAALGLLGVGALRLRRRFIPDV